MKGAYLALLLGSILAQVTGQNAPFEGLLPTLQRFPEPLSSALSTHEIRELRKKLLLADNLFGGLKNSFLLNGIVERNETSRPFTSGKKSSQRSATDLTGLKPQCVADTVAYVSQLSHRAKASLWALQMADAVGKPSAGIFSGRLLFLGDFDECRRIVANYTPTAQSFRPVDGLAYDMNITERKFKGQYCTGKYRVNLPKFPPEGQYYWGVCVPDSCNENDAVYLANMALSYYKLSSIIQFESMLCHERDVPWSDQALVVLIIGIAMASIVLVATLVDGLLIRLQWMRQEEFASGVGVNGVNRSPHGCMAGDNRGSLGFVGWRADQPLVLDSNPEPSASIDKGEGHEESWPSLPLKTILAFSAITNTKNMFNTKQSKDSLPCLNGIRVMSMNWVVLGHTALCLTYFSDNLAAYFNTAIKRWSFQVIINTNIAVDSYFVLSGLLVSYLNLNDLRRAGGKLNWIHFYSHRYLRLTPVYMLAIGIWVCLLPYIIDGPMFPQKTGFEKNFCKHTWWGNLLYVQNLIKFKDGYCFGVGWYLAVDMQFYILSPLMIVPLYLRPKLGFLISAVFFLVTTITPFALTEARYYHPRFISIKDHPKALGDQFHELYTAPYCRMASYVIGILTGYLIYMYKMRGERIRLSWPTVTAGWILASFTALAVLYGLFPYHRDKEPMNLHVAAAYNSLSRPAWGLSVAWVIFTCVTGWSGPVNRFLGWVGWQPLAKLTYTVYLVHGIVLAVIISSARTPPYINDLTIAVVYMATLMGSYSLAYVISVIFEAPFMALEKVLLKKEKVNKMIFR